MKDRKIERSKQKYILFNNKIKKFYVKHEISPRLHRKTQSNLTNIITSEKDVDYTECSYGNAAGLMMKRKNIEKTVGTILYCHGGGYNTGDLSYCKILGSKLAKVSNMNVIAFLYPLTPENPYPSQLLHAMKVYREIAEEFGEITAIVGDSAGGHLALGMLQKIRNSDMPMPKKAIFMSPWTDLTLSGESYVTKKNVDVSLTPLYMEFIRKCFCKMEKYESPLISPLFADFSGFPKTLIQVGTDEILLDDSVRLSENMKKFGVEVEFEVYEGVGHVFQMFPEKVMPQEGEAMVAISDFLLNQEKSIVKSL